MPIGQIIVGGIVALIAILSGIYCSFTARGKGPILSNTYLFLSKEERTKADKKAEYKLVTVVFSCISAIFALLALYIFTALKWMYIPIGALVVFLLIYVIAEAAKTERKSRRQIPNHNLGGNRQFCSMSHQTCKFKSPFSPQQRAGVHNGHASQKTHLPSRGEW